MAIFVHPPGGVGAWHRLIDAWVGAGGAWKKIKKVWVEDGGAWKLAYSDAGVLNPLPIDAIGDVENSPTNALATLTVHTDGTITTVGNACNTGSNWYLPTTGGIGNTHWVTLNKLSGDDPTSGDLVGFILAMTSNRSWSWAQNVIGSKSGSFQIRFWTDSGATQLVGTANFTVEAEVA